MQCTFCFGAHRNRTSGSTRSTSGASCWSRSFRDYELSAKMSNSCCCWTKHRKKALLFSKERIHKKKSWTNEIVWVLGTQTEPCDDRETTTARWKYPPRVELDFIMPSFPTRRRRRRVPSVGRRKQPYVQRGTAAASCLPQHWGCAYDLGPWKNVW